MFFLVKITGGCGSSSHAHNRLVSVSTSTLHFMLKAMPHGSDFYNEFAKIPQIYEKSYRAMEFSTKSL